MNKAQKRLVSSLAAASSVAAAIAPAATVFAATKDEATALVAEAKKTLAFVDYNQAYAAIMALPEADQPALLAELAPLAEKAVTPDVKAVLTTMDDLAKEKDLKNYYDLYAMIEKTVSLPRNQQYLMGELTSWGKSAVFTEDVVAATDAVIKAYTDKTAESIAKAKELAAKVTNAGSLAWLTTEIETASKAVPIAVSSVTAKTANSLVVKFSRAVEDTAKVAITVKNYTTPVNVTIAWNTDNTEATLTNASNFPEGNYTVNVKNDTTDLGTTNVAIAAQKVAKIEITSSKVAVTNTKVNNKYLSYASYKVLDQYGNDITSSYLANSLMFQTGYGNVSYKDGRLTIESDLTLMQFSTVVITGYDTTTGISTTATLNTSQAVGTLNGIELKGLIDNGKVLTADDTTTVFYIDYSATDMSDNATTDYELVKNGLILTGDSEITVSAPSYVSAKVVQDPTNSKKAAIEVKAKTGAIQMDLPVTITAMTSTGKTSSLNLTLKKQASVDTFTLMAPTTDIAVGEVKEIPFVAYDQNGTQVTKYTDLTKSENLVTFSDTNKMKLVENSDGTARLEVGSWDNDGPQIMTAVSKSGKMSTLTLNVQKQVKADQLDVVTNKVQFLQVGAVQKYDFWDKGGLTVKDQYGRPMDMKTAARYGYKVIAETSSSNVTLAGLVWNDNVTETVGLTPQAISGKSTIQIKGQSEGSATVVFKLYDKDNKELSSKSLTFTVIADKDITGFVLDAVPTVYAAAPKTADITAAGVSARQKEYMAEPDLYGTTSNGTKVVLEKATSGSSRNRIISAFIDNDKDFILKDSFSTTTPGAYDGIAVYAKDLDENRTSATTTLTLTVMGFDDKIKTLSTQITSSTAKPVASSVEVVVGNALKNLTDGKAVAYQDGETIKVKLTQSAFDALKITKGAYMVNFKPEDTKKLTEIYFRPVDQYGEKAWTMSYIGASGGNVTTAGFSVNSDGSIETADISKIKKNDYIYLTGVTSNGISKTVKIEFVDKFSWE